VEVSPDLISAVTDAVLEEIAAWQGRPLEPVYRKRSSGALVCGLDRSGVQAAAFAG
jgi:transposase-like protein